MSKRSSTATLDLPILTISNGGALKVLKDAHLQAGGHFYATGGPTFAPNDEPPGHVFIQVESSGIVHKSFTVSPGTSIATARLKVERFEIFATVHPMYESEKKDSKHKYYLAPGTEIKAGEYPLASSPTTTNTIKIHIVAVAAGKEGHLAHRLHVITDGARHDLDVQVTEPNP